MITLAIVGVVAAITLPPLITNIQSQVKAKRVQNIKQKFSKATDKMLAMSGMNGYGSTENFVEELKHHLKIAKVCDNDHLTECWGYEKVKIRNGKEWEVAETKTSRTLRLKNDGTHQWDDTVGIVIADGTSMILSYNKKCNMTMDVNPQWDENQSTSADCVAAVFDWNGPKKPNMFDNSDNKHIAKSDIALINAGGLGRDCIVELNGKCFTGIYGIPTAAEASKYGYTWCAGHEPTTTGLDHGTPYGPDVAATTKKDEDGNSPAELGIKKCRFINDYWNAAVHKCGHVDNLPSQSDLEELANMIYGTTIFTNSGTKKYYNLTVKQEVISALGMPDPIKTADYSYYSNDERDAGTVGARYFGSHSDYSNYGSNPNRRYTFRVMCSDEK